MVALSAGRFLFAVPHLDETSLATYIDVGKVTLEGVVVGEKEQPLNKRSVMIPALIRVNLRSHIVKKH
jgi:hypothetical protein